jgi:hypothetical protein
MSGDNGDELEWNKIENIHCLLHSSLTVVQIGTFLCRVVVRYYMKSSCCHILEVDAREEPTDIFGLGSVAPIATLCEH